MKVTTSKSKNSESFYIAKSYINNKGNANKPTSCKTTVCRDIRNPFRDAQNRTC